MAKDDIKKEIQKYKARNLSLRDQNICSLRNRKKTIDRLSKIGIPLTLDDKRTIEMCMHFVIAELIKSEMDMIDT